MAVLLISDSSDYPVYLNGYNLAEIIIMNRRHVILGGTAVTATLFSSTALWYSQLECQHDLSVKNLLTRLTQLITQKPVFSGHWNAVEVFNHLAQSVEFSMSGYPEHKSDLFKTLIGKSAFKVFYKQGSMRHSLSEVIPGAPAINVGDPQVALQRLITALTQFEAFTGQLQPHFAYGSLSHQEYSAAHVMHVHNHLQELA